jgi:hypothetical protein
MADFTSSFQKGIDAAKRAEQNRAEVDAVFAELNAQIGASTEQKIEIVRGTVADTVANALGAGLAALFTSKRVPALLVTNKKDPQHLREIAKWKQDPYGYPCTISVDGDVMHCENRVGLERGLSQLLGSSAVGEAVLAALNHVPETKAP